MAVEQIRRIEGRGLPLEGDNIDTDRIIPARFLRSVSFEGLEAHLFADDRAQVDAVAPRCHPMSDPRYDGATILIVNANFGCGSSREHAPQAIRRRGFHAVIGESFSEIFFGNSLALGLPCVSAEAGAIDEVMSAVADNPGLRLTIDLQGLTLTAGDRVWDVTVPASARDALLDGSWDATGLLLDRYDDVTSVASRLPYIRGY
jgi:3-isopropylmalate/(R)-2-methylmalate dehydratase small subunit